MNHPADAHSVARPFRSDRRSTLRRLLSALVAVALTATSLVVAASTSPAAALDVEDGAAYSRSTTATTQFRDWMKYVENDTPLWAMSLPGSHETLSRDQGSIFEDEYLQNHTMSLREQLEAGIRVFDFRLRMTWNETTQEPNLGVHHGEIYLDAQFGSGVLCVIEQFLDENPTEAVIMRLGDAGVGTSIGHGQDENGDAYVLNDDMYDHVAWFRDVSDCGGVIWETEERVVRETRTLLDENGVPQVDSDGNQITSVYAYRHPPVIPKLGDVRGQAVIAQDWHDSSERYLGIRWNGRDGTGHQQNVGSSGLDVHWEAIEAFMTGEVAKNDPSRDEYFDFDDDGELYPTDTDASDLPLDVGYENLYRTEMNGTDAFDPPWKVAEHNNPEMLRLLIEGGIENTGVVMMDFPGDALIAAIIARNLQHAGSFGQVGEHWRKLLTTVVGSLDDDEATAATELASFSDAVLPGRTTATVLDWGYVFGFDKFNYSVIATDLNGRRDVAVFQHNGYAYPMQSDWWSTDFLRWMIGHLPDRSAPADVQGRTLYDLLTTTYPWTAWQVIVSDSHDHFGDAGVGATTRFSANGYSFSIRATNLEWTTIQRIILPGELPQHDPGTGAISFVPATVEAPGGSTFTLDVSGSIAIRGVGSTYREPEFRFSHDAGATWSAWSTATSHDVSIAPTDPTVVLVEMRDSTHIGPGQVEGAVPIRREISITPTNVAPEITALPGTSVGFEGDPMSLTVNFTDRNGAQPFVVDVDWGDGTTASKSGVDVTELADGSWQAVFDHTYADNAPFDPFAPPTRTVTATVSDGTDAVGATKSIAVYNRAPAVVGGDPSPIPAISVEAGGTAELTITVTDVEADVLSATVSGDAIGTIAATLIDKTDSVRTFTAAVPLDGIPDGAIVDYRWTVGDGDGGQLFRNGSIAILNAIADLHVDEVHLGPEGHLSVIEGHVIDPGFDNVSVFVDWGDGTREERIQATFGGDGVHFFVAEHTYRDDEPSSGWDVQLTPWDGDERGQVVDVRMAVANLDPEFGPGSLAITGGPEGMATHVSGRVTDPGLDDLDDLELFVAWDGGDPVSVPLESAGDHLTFSIEHLFADDGTYPVELRLIDGDGGEATAALTADVANVVPQIVDIEVEPTSEGRSSDLRVRVLDAIVEADMAVRVEWLPGVWSNMVRETTEPDGSTVWAASWSFADGGTYPLSIVVDDGEASVRGSGTIDVAHVTATPHITSFGGTPVEGTPVQIGGLVSDPGLVDEHTVTIDWGDGTETEATVTRIFGSIVVFSGSHTYVDDSPADAPYPVVVRATAAGEGVGTASLVLPIANAAPTVDVSIEAGVEGSPVQAHIAISDIGISDVHSLTVRWGDGAETTQVVAASGEVVRDVELTHVYADNSPDGAPFVVEVVVTDDGVPFAAEPVLVEIANVGPSDLEIAALDHRGDPVVSGGDVLVDRPLAITVAFTDPGADEHTVTATVDGVTVGMVMESDGGYAATLNPAEPGIATVEVTVIDDDGAAAAAVFEIVVLDEATAVEQALVTGLSDAWAAAPSRREAKLIERALGRFEAAAAALAIDDNAAAVHHWASALNVLEKADGSVEPTLLLELAEAFYDAALAEVDAESSWLEWQLATANSFAIAARDVEATDPALALHHWATAIDILD